MTNLEKWRSYLSGLESPSSYIDWSFYSMVSSCLQRRVWYGDIDPVFPNLYILLIGPPACGKGRVIKQATACLKSFQLKVEEGRDPIQRIPVAADSVTLEKLTQDLAGSSRAHIVKQTDGEGKTKELKYCHCSLSFQLEELSTLFRRHTEDLMRFLIVAYDCAKEFRRATKSQGTDDIKNMCLNILGGTQATTLQECSEIDIINSGFASRIILVTEEKPRFRKFDSPVSPEQLNARFEVLQHFEKLLTIYGPLKYAPGALEWVTEWYEKRSDKEIINRAPSLLYYYGRKKLHLMKLAAAIHFSDNIDMEITISDFEKANEALRSIEPNMHKALAPSSTISNNPLSPIEQRIASHIETVRTMPIEHLRLYFNLRAGDVEEVKESLLYGGKARMHNVNSKFYLVHPSIPDSEVASLVMVK